jgi:signal transduction histidine kinase
MFSDMGSFIIGFLVVLAIVVLLIGYLVTFVPILGVDEVKRYPFMAVVSLVLVYLESLACGYFWAVPTVRVIMAVLIGGLLLAYVKSLFSAKKGNPLSDLFAFILFTAGSVYILYPNSYVKMVNSIRDVWASQEITANTYIGIAVLSISSILAGFVVTTFYNLNKRINALDYQIDKRYKQNVNIQSFNEPYQKYLLTDIKDMIEQVGRDVVDEVRNTNYESGLGPVFTPMDDLTKLTREVKSLKKLLKKEIRKQEDFSVGDFVSDVKHSLMTPLSQILSNCELMEDELRSEKAKQYVDRIERNVKVCQSIINSYKEVAAIAKTKTFIGLREACDACLESAGKEYGKDSVTIVYGNGFVDAVEGYSNNLLIGLVAPLINNAVAASPGEASIDINIEEEADKYHLTISNFCENEAPTLMQLNTIGFSSKNNHQGVGLSTVRNLIRLMKSAELKFEVNENKVTVIINLEKRVKQHEGI